MTPMIDIVFLMLVFFLLTFKPVDVMAHLDALRPRGTDFGKPVPVLRLEVDTAGYRLNGRPVDVTDMAALLHRFGDLDAKQSILVISSADAPHAGLITALNACEAAGLTQVSVLSGAGR